MYGFEEDTWKDWQKKRRRTLIGLIIVGSSVGIDATMMFSTMVLYLKDIVQVLNPHMWYGLITAAYFISSTVFGMVSGRWLDKTRHLRRYVMFVILVQIVGFILYLQHWHPIFLLVGRTICGISDPYPGVVIGELYRIYDGPDATIATIWLSTVYAVGFMIGPGLTVLSSGIEIKIGSLLITRLNFVGILMPCWLFLCIIPAYFLIHDCSKVFDLKEYLTKQTLDEVKSNAMEDETMERKKITADLYMDEEDLPFGIQDTKENESTALCQSKLELRTAQCQSQVKSIKVIKALLENPDSLLILASTFFFIYGLFTLFALVPLLFTVILKWDLNHLSAFYLICGMMEFTTLFTISKCVKTNRSIYFSAIISIICQIINCIVLIQLTVLKDWWIEYQYFLMAVYLVTMQVSWNFDEVMMKVIFSNLVPSSVQSFSETVRNGLSRMAMIAGSLTVGVILPWAEWWAVGVIVVYVVLLVAFISRRKTLVNPQQMQF